MFIIKKMLFRNYSIISDKFQIDKNRLFIEKQLYVKVFSCLFVVFLSSK